MDPRLLHYYNLELQHLREMGAEFAEEFPKIAARLGINGLEVTDPYVERLLEGVGFMAARVQLKLDAEFPRFTQALLEGVHPHYLAPDARRCSWRSASRTPTSRTSPAGSPSRAARRCRASSWPIQHAVRVPDRARRGAVAARDRLGELLHARARSAARGPAGGAPRIKGGLRIRLRTTAELTFAQTAVEHLTFHLTGRQDVANWLYELCLAAPLRQDAARMRRRADRLGGRPDPDTRTAAAHRAHAGRVLRRGGAAAGEPAVVPGLPPAPGVFFVPAAVPVHGHRRASASVPPDQRQRAGAGHPAVPGACPASRASWTRRTSRSSALRPSTCSRSGPIAFT